MIMTEPPAKPTKLYRNPSLGGPIGIIHLAISAKCHSGKTLGSVTRFKVERKVIGFLKGGENEGHFTIGPEIADSVKNEKDAYLCTLNYALRDVLQRLSRDEENTLTGWSLVLVTSSAEHGNLIQTSLYHPPLESEFEPLFRLLKSAYELSIKIISKDEGRQLTEAFPNLVAN